jgi:uncharacterized phage protein (TIGR02220 family)
MGKVLRIDVDQLNELPFDELKIIKALVKLHYGQNMQQVVKDLSLSTEVGQQLSRFMVEQKGRQLLPLLFCEPVAEELDQVIHTVTYEMNQCLGTDYKAAEVRKYLIDWYRAGYTTPEPFIAVVKDMSAAWRENPQLKTHLRPATLFGKKFSEYRNLAMIVASPNTVDIRDEFTGV